MRLCIRIFLLFSAISWAGTQTARAETIRMNLQGTESGIEGFWGQSVVTPTGGGWNSLSFNFYSETGPLAFGNIFLLTAEYLGLPSSLSASTLGYLAQAAASGGAYIFDPEVTLSGNTQYFFYTDSIGSGLLGRTPSGVEGEGHYFAFEDWTFQGPYAGVNYLLQGTATSEIEELPTPTPEPGTWTLLGLGLVGLGLFRRRSRERA